MVTSAATPCPTAAVGPEQPASLVEHFFRHEAGRLVSVLAKHFGARHLDLVEDMVQSALAEALQAWRLKGIPENPTGWVRQVAKNKILDSLKHRETVLRLAPAYARLKPMAVEVDTLFDESGIEDAQLRMMFACCHPVLARQDQIALTLKTLCGFSIAEIAAGLLQSEETMKKRLQRARQQLAEVPGDIQDVAAEELPPRIEALHQCLYLLFNEGYAASGGDELLRKDVCEEAIRLSRLLSHNRTFGTPATHALVALMLFHAARFATRTDTQGRLLVLEEQDRTRWNLAMLLEAEKYLDDSAEGTQVTVYHLQAGIAYQHCQATSIEKTNWTMIKQLYDVLCHKDHSPIYALNRAVAIAQLQGPEAGLEALQALGQHPALKDYAYYYGACGEFHRLAGRLPEAERYYQRAWELARTTADRELILRRLESCQV